MIIFNKVSYASHGRVVIVQYQRVVCLFFLLQFEHFFSFSLSSGDFIFESVIVVCRFG